MIDHTHYRRSIMIDPHGSDPELLAHRAGCDECRIYTERLLRFEVGLTQAMRVDFPAARRPLRSTRPRGWMALAASVLLGLCVAGGMWISLSGPSLAADVVAHMADEPQAWRRTDREVPESALNAVLRDSKLRLSARAGIVSYASGCLFRGHVVPHLVVQTESGPVTVMVLTREASRKPQPFDEQGYRGTIVPVPGHGSIAVLMRAAGETSHDVNRIAAQVLDAIVWTG